MITELLYNYIEFGNKSCVTIERGNSLWSYHLSLNRTDENSIKYNKSLIVFNIKSCVMFVVCVVCVERTLRSITA